MSDPTSVPGLERTGFFHGQRLLAEDLGNVLEYQEQVRFLHNQVLHGWGIALGLEVIGSIGDRTISVRPGYALDCQGRDILLAKTEEGIQIPPVAGNGVGDPLDYLLTVSYVDDADLPEAESRDGVCTPGGAVRRTEQPRIRWCDPRASYPSPAVYRPGIDIILARVQVLECALAADPDLSPRRSLAQPKRPMIRSGRTRQGFTPWELLFEGGATTGVRTFVDTTDALFDQTPTYLAQLVGDFELNIQLPAGPVSTLGAGWSRVSDPTPAGFWFEVVLPTGLSVGGRAINSSAVFNSAAMEALRTDAHWHVHWAGLE